MALQQSEIWRSTAVRGDPRRADLRLRTFARREGEAVFCRECDGIGKTATLRTLDGLKKCGRCGGEGLEPCE